MSEPLSTLPNAQSLLAAIYELARIHRQEALYTDEQYGKQARLIMMQFSVDPLYETGQLDKARSMEVRIEAAIDELKSIEMQAFKETAIGLGYLAEPVNEQQFSDLCDARHRALINNALAEA